MKPQEKTIRDAFKFRPVPTLNVCEFADKYRVLTGSGAAVSGPFLTSRVEVARGPMLSVTEPGVRTITAMTCTQLLKTTLLENTIAYFACLSPCPMMLTQAKDSSVKSFSKERLAPMLKASKKIGAVFDNDGARDATQSFKTFHGGFLALESAGSPTNLAMRAIRVTMLDEIDKYETTKEGDPVILAEERTSTFATNSLHIRTCSPTMLETSRIYRSYMESDQRRPFVCCPNCNAEATWDFFKHVSWDKTEGGQHKPETAAIFCLDCGTAWTDAERMKVLTTKGAIKWRQTREFVCCEEHQKPTEEKNWNWDAVNEVGLATCKHCKREAVPNNHAGFTASKLYSPFIKKVSELAATWLLNKDDPESKQTFYNTQLGQPFESSAATKVSMYDLTDRREPYPAEAPFDVVAITMGVDIQGGLDGSNGRVEVETVGWTVTMQSYSLDYSVMSGNFSDAATQELLDQHVNRLWRHESGRDMVAQTVCVDSGGHSTESVYRWARPKISRGIWAIKGASESSNAWGSVWPTLQLKKGKTKNAGYRPIIIGTNSAKEWIYESLKVADPLASRFCHFPTGRPEVYFDQLTAETLVTERKAGTTIRKYVLPRGRANEALDCRVYAYAALMGGIATGRINLRRLAERINAIVRPALAPAPPVDAPPVSAVAPAPAAPPPVSRPLLKSGWVRLHMSISSIGLSEIAQIECGNRAGWIKR